MATLEALPIPPVFRVASLDDMAFIATPWLAELRLAPVCRNVSDVVFYKRMRPMIAALVERGDVCIAEDGEDPQLLYGFIAATAAPRVCHWIYVKSVFWGYGVGRALWRQAFGDADDDVRAPFVVDRLIHGPISVAARRRRLLYDPWAFVQR